MEKLIGLSKEERPLSSAATPLVVATEAYVQESLAENDASHDYAHIMRVRSIALQLADMEGVTSPTDREEVELAALLHDIADYKYSGSLTAGVEAALAWLASQGVGEERAQKVASIIESVGFKNEVGGGVAVSSLLHGIVQDADRLDAIGAVGIARTFSYGGRKGRPFYPLPGSQEGMDGPRVGTMTTEEYVAKSSGCTLYHFYEKLLLLRDLMKTDAGRDLAEQRHQFMLLFLDQFYLEAGGPEA